MKIAVIGGTHGNEPCGIEVIRWLDQRKSSNDLHPCQTFLGNPKAYELKKRYVDTDLNRAFGPNGSHKGYETERVQFLEEKIRGNFDFSLDLHTTTTNMGSTLILNNTHEQSRKMAAYLQKKNPSIKIIEELKLDEESTHLNRLTPASLSVEIGPVANNVLDAHIIFQMQKIIKDALYYDNSSSLDLEDVEYFKEMEVVPYPKEGIWYVHPDLQGQDFQELKPGAPLFVSPSKEVQVFQGTKTLYPFFINEAAYIEKDMAMILAEKKKGFLD